jgi:hypothetical protein
MIQGISSRVIQEKLQDAAGAEFPLVAWGLGYKGPSTYAIWAVTLIVLALGAAIGWFTYHSLSYVGVAVGLAMAAHLGLRSRLKVTLLGVSPRHFIAIDVTRGSKFRPPALQGLSAIQYPRVIEKELSNILHYNLGDGSIQDVRFQNFRHLPDNRNAAYRLRKAVLENV